MVAKKFLVTLSITIATRAQKRCFALAKLTCQSFRFHLFIGTVNRELFRIVQLHIHG